MSLSIALLFGALALIDGTVGILRGSPDHIVVALACAMASVGSACAGVVAP